MIRLLLTLVVGALCSASAVGVSPDPKDLTIPPQEISKARELVRKLGSEVYKEREEAYAELVKMGRLARPALLEAATSDPDPEVRFRSSRLLPKAGADDLKARLDTFLADVDGKYKHQLPGWEKFVDTTREHWGLFGYPVWVDKSADKLARELFVEVVKSPYNLELLQAVDGTTTEAGRAIADRRAMLYGHLQQRNIGGRIVNPQPINLPDIACLLFAENVTPSKEIPRSGMFSYVTGATFIQQASSNNTLNNAGAPHAEAYRRIVGTWIGTREDVQDLNQLVYIAGQQLRNFPESLPLLRRIVTTDGVYGYAKGQALMHLMQRRPKEELAFLQAQLKNDTLVTTVWFGNVNPNQQPQQHQCLLRDVALAMLLTQSGQKMTDYGFKFPPGTPVPNNGTIGYGNYAFESEDARNAAMVKYGFWRLKKSLNPDPEPAKKDDAPPVPGPAKP